MPSYKIIIDVTEVGGVYTAENMEEAQEIAQTECENIYSRLNGRCSVEVVSVEEI